MAKKSKKKIGGNKPKTQELGLSGPGVEPLVIPEIEKAAKSYASARDERISYGEVEDEKQKALLDVMNKHRSELVQEVGGGVSYRFGDTLVELKPTSEKVKVKSIHDEASQAE
jgi:hypothetical protein